MAARKRIGTKDIPWNESTRKKIQASQIINALTKHVMGDLDMKSSQVTAALGLLKKTLPDLQSTELTSGGGPAIPVLVISESNNNEQSKGWS